VFFYLLTYLLNVDADIATLCKYSIDIVSKSKKVISKHHYLTVTLYVKSLSAVPQTAHSTVGKAFCV